MKPARNFQPIRRTGSFFLCALSILSLVRPVRADDFAEIIRKTDPRTPEEQRKTFHLPPGFEIQLVASEPQICKPMNMAFDAQGKLWITQSREYPFPVLPVDKGGRDKVMVIENLDANGKAQKITTFAEGLNIPIGLYPYKNGVLAFSIPKIHYFQDTDGDGKADKDDVMLSGFGYDKDTHGLTSHFSRGFDGFIYADHGFHNDSTVVGKDGSTITMNSGNCYRFQPDGTHVEQFSWGQVNPFGLMFDPLGDLWASDCHSSPTYLLLRGAYYPSFGKPHDGLGFAPNICKHSHGSTAIAGMVYYAATNFPAEYRGNTFIGNVMTCRINRDSYPEQGSTRMAKEEPDFLSCDDPWFRPVDVQLGPDGALYIADFYNRIIGHYEVPLDHPGRDRERGRIWRVVYTGKESTGSNLVTPQLALPKDTKGLIAELGNANLTRRMLAMNKLVDEIGQPAVKPVQKMMRDKKATATQKAHGLWVLQRLGALDEKTLAAASRDADSQVRVHTMRAISESSRDTGVLSAGIEQLVLNGLEDKNAFVQRAAADALGQHPNGAEKGDFKAIHGLLKLRQNIPAEDSELLHVTRIALRNQLLSAGTLAHLQKTALNEADSRALADVAIGAKSEAAGLFLLSHLEKFSEPEANIATYLHHASRYAPVSEMDAIARFTQKKFGKDIDFQLTLFKTVQEALAQRGAQMGPGVRAWGAELAGKLLASVDPETLEWANKPFRANREKTNPWFLEMRNCSDEKREKFISSLPGGETLNGTLRSKAFTIPEQFSFFVGGHDGPMNRKIMKRNFVRLRDAKTDELLMEARPPRNDVAQPVKWDLKPFAGRKGVLEIIDGNTNTAFAWITVGRFDPPVVALPTVFPNQVDKRQQLAAELAGSLNLPKLAPQLNDLLLNINANTDARSAAAKSLVALNIPTATGTLEQIVSNAEEPMKMRETAAQSLAELNSPSARTGLIEAMSHAPQNLQTQIALALAGKPEGAESLLVAVEDAKASARLLQDRNIKDRLTAAKPANLAARLEKLTKYLPTVNAERQKTIDERIAKFDLANASVETGAQVFKNNCAVCHTLDGQGGLIGPQLDGVGNRGPDRIIEDILDPSRNVDRAFRTSLVVTKDGDVESGLFRREEGEVIVLAQSTGKEISIPKKEVKERRESETSLMPDNFSETIPLEDFNNLLSFLMSHGTKASAKK